MFITWPQQLSNLQFDSGFQLWSAVDLVRPDHCFVASMVDVASGDRRTTFIASDLDLQTFLSSAPQGWKPDGVTILVPPEADGARNWRAFELAAIERPISQEQSADLNRPGFRGGSTL